MGITVVRYLATEDELSLLDDIDEVGYGEIYNIERRSQPSTEPIEITEKMHSFFTAMKIVKKANRLIIHEGEPVTLEYRGKTGSGRRCLKKMKL